MQHTGGFVAAVLPWTLTPAEHTKYSSQTIFEPPELKQPTSHAIKLLDFPAGLRAYMGLPGRTYCVWWSPGDGTTATPGLETNQLHAIMKSCKAKNVGHKADVRVVFVHVGALVTLHRLPALAERRSKRPEINFYTYGSHTSVPRERWGVYPIYPLGVPACFYPFIILSLIHGHRRYRHLHSRCITRGSHHHGSTHAPNIEAPLLGLLPTSFCNWNGCEIIVRGYGSVIGVQSVSAVCSLFDCTDIPIDFLQR